MKLFKPRKAIISVYVTEEEAQMLADITKKLFTYQELSRSKIFCIALKEMYEKHVLENKGK